MTEIIEYDSSPYSPAQIIQGMRYAEDTATGQLWFVARDVCAQLGTEAEDIPKILDRDEYCSLLSLKGIPSLRGISNLAGLRKDTRMLSEPGLYSLIFRSRKPEAKMFQRWVCKEVLPSIRKHGAYFTPAKVTEILLSDLDALVVIARQMKASRDRQPLGGGQGSPIFDVTLEQNTTR